MECTAKQAASQRAMQALLRPRLRPQPRRLLLLNQQQPQSLPPAQHSARLLHVSRAGLASKDPSKPIVLEQPDKFRPPSHAARRNARSTTAMYGGGAAYNQGMTARERVDSRAKSYPNMFPEEGTRMHWFLTTKWVHFFIAMFVLCTLAITSAISTWAKTSPFSHLIPPLNMLFFSPLSYFSEVMSVYRLHMDYQTQQVAEARRQNILDAQKRRLYRRAHGLEDLNADEVSGVDVRGLVEWDDGLTNKERERGGQYRSEMIGAAMRDMGQQPGEDFTDLMERKRAEQVMVKERREEEKRRKVEEEARLEEERLVRIGAKKREEELPKRKLWLGLW